MLNEVSSYGPIVCGLDKTASEFVNYEGGIIK